MGIKDVIKLFMEAEKLGNSYYDLEGEKYICIPNDKANKAVTFLKTLVPKPSKPLPKILFFDTETSGFIQKKLSYDDPNQAWCVQIGAILCDEEQTYNRFNIIIKANNRAIHYKAQEVHGISVEKSNKEGIPELEVTNKFGKLMSQASLLVCHNFAFDWPIVYQMMQRNLNDLDTDARSAFYLDLPSFCTMKDKRIQNYVGATNKNGRIKWPKLEELYFKLFNKKFSNAHDAFADIQATADCYFELIEKKVIDKEI